jgi:DNA-binding transcriptional ArsR family regulator
MSSTALPLSAAEKLDLTGLDTRPLRVAHSPLPGVLSLIAEALGRHNGAPERWRRTVRSTLSRRDLLAVLPVFGRDHVLLPDCLTPIPAVGAASPTDIVDEIAATDPDVLLTQAAAEYGQEPPPAWNRVEDRPERWLEEWATTLGRVMDAVGDVWSAAQPLLDRETERIGMAAMLGAPREVLATLHASSRVEGDELVMDRGGTEPLRWSVDDEGLVLVPMLGGDRALVSWHRGDAMTHLAYPVAGQQRLLDEGEAGEDDALQRLLGARRAMILRLLDRPRTAGAIAEALGAVPSAATHHVAALESAGLVARERRGQHVQVRRTARGTGLLALYERAG